MALITNEYGNEGRYGSSGEIIIRPKWRYVFITAFLPVLVYCTTLVLWMMFRSAGPWILHVVYRLVFPFYLLHKLDTDG